MRVIYEGLKGARTLGDGLAARARPLATLDLRFAKGPATSLPAAALRDGDDGFVDVSDRRLGPAAAVVVAILLGKNASVTAVDASGNRELAASDDVVKRYGLDALLGLAKAKRLRGLDLLRSLGCADAAATAVSAARAALSLCGGHAPGPFALRGSRRGLDDGDALLAAHELARAGGSLTDLNLGGNPAVGPDGVAAIARAARVQARTPSPHKLTRLDLSHVDVGGGASAIADALLADLHLTELNLRFSKLDSAGAEDIAECLGMATKLTKLDVSANGLSPAARRALADAADANPKLRVRF